MRDVDVIKEARNKIRVTIDKISKEIKSLRNDKSINELDVIIQQHIGRLISLKHHYIDQEITLNFVLNEDSKLWNFETFSNYSGLDEFFHDANSL